MGAACQTDNTVGHQLQSGAPIQNNEGNKTVYPSSNPFYDLGEKQFNEYNILSKYQFHSNYSDQFLGQCSVIQEKTTGDLYLCKQLEFSNQVLMKQKIQQLEARKTALDSQHVIKIKQIIVKSTDGFFGERKKALVIIDYPFINFQRQIGDRMVKKISFSNDEVLNFLNSTIKGYAAIERAGFNTDRVRLKNIFVGIKNKQSIIKVAQNSLIQPKTNLEYMIIDGPNSINNKDIYLSPEQYLAWADGNNQYIPNNPKSGVYSLGMCFLDMCIMDSSRQIYHFTQKKMDQGEVRNRIEIVGKKYGGALEKVLRQMLEEDPEKRIGFQQLQQTLPSLSKTVNTEGSKMRLSVIPNQRSSYINNEKSNLRSSQMFKSVVSNVNASQSRVFASRIKMDQSRIKDEQVLQIAEHYTNGNKYLGQKRGQMKHGKGRYDLADGSYYDGEWFQNKINGRGILYFRNGKPQYDGQWRNDLYNGWGTLYSQTSNWDKYEGEFKNGVKEGRGRLYFKNGVLYDGEFRGDKISGRGRKISPNGQVVQKYWDTISPSLFS